MTYVTCPTMRYHPAVVAQKAATLQLLSDGRFTLGLGAGENLNEHVIGEGWPPVAVRAGDARRGHRRSSASCSPARLRRPSTATTSTSTRQDLGPARRRRPDRRRGLRAGSRAELAGQHGRRHDRRRAEGRARRDVRRAPAAPASRAIGQIADLLRHRQGRRGRAAPTSSSAGSAAAGRSTPTCPGRRASPRPRSSSREEDVAERDPCGTTSTRCVEAAQRVRRRRLHHLALVQIGEDAQPPFLEWSAVDAHAGLAGRLRLLTGVPGTRWGEAPPRGMPGGRAPGSWSP